MKLKNILIYYIGLVFIFASLHRLFLKSDREEEIKEVFKLPKNFDYLIIIFEFITGILLLINFKYKIYVLFILFLFLILFTLILIYNNFTKLLNSYNEIFTYKPTMTSLFLHITYIIIIAAILYEDKDIFNNI